MKPCGRGDGSVRRIFGWLAFSGLISLLAALLAGCSSPAPTPAQSSGSRAAAGGGKKIAIISPAKTSFFHTELPKGAAEEAQKLGWPSIIDQAPAKESDYTGQVALAQDIIQQRPDAISVCGINPEALTNIVAKANQAGIPIFVHNQISPTKGTVAAYIGYDELAGGKLCGEKMVELLKKKNGAPKGEVAILDGEPGDHTNARAGGFKQALSAYPDIKVVAEQNGHWLAEPSASTTRDWLQRFPQLDGVFGCSDQMAQAAAKVASDAKHPLITIGIDGNDDTLQDIKSGAAKAVTATLAVQPRLMGATIIDTMDAYFKGKKPGPVVKTPMVIITKDNVDQYVK
ncbi:MAG TPA: sugar ABC transporter substrate-binding protein [Chthonomonadales bacterium]|nr:sugar ABC transporter substrate-binding protein [Chthonomonadales bacterium]